MYFYVDGVARGSITNIDNDAASIDRANLGAISGVTSATNGTYYFDEFESRTNSLPGASGSGLNLPNSSSPITGTLYLDDSTFITGTLAISDTAFITDTIWVTETGWITDTIWFANTFPDDLPNLDETTVLTETSTLTSTLDLILLPELVTVQTLVPITYNSPVRIDYTYDDLNRRTAADYSNGDYFHYTYDRVGNRLTQSVTLHHEAPITTNYEYDIANRLTTVDGVTLQWDANGNLLQDERLRAYTYNHSNRLIEETTTQTKFNYNGLGDRLSETIAGVSTNFTLDLEAGLTQVLWDGGKLYLYGVGRIGENDANGWGYYQVDALAWDAEYSVRQLSSMSQVRLAKSYEPYGEVVKSAPIGKNQGITTL